MPSTTVQHRVRRSRRARSWIQRQVATLTGKVVVLLALVVLVTLAGSTLIYFGLEALPTYGDALWWTMDHLIDPGALSEDVGWEQRIVGLLLVLAGLIVLAGILFTLVTEVVDRSLERLATVDISVDARDHLLLVGWNDATPDILRALNYLRPRLLAGAPSPFERVVVLAPDTMRDQRAHIQEMLAKAIPGDHEQVVFGNLLHADSYQRAAARDAYAVVISGTVPDEQSVTIADANAVQTAATLTNYLASAGASPTGHRPLVSVILYSGEHADAAEGVLPPHVAGVVVDRVVTGMLAVELTAPAWGRAVRDLLVSGSGASVHLVRDDRLTGSVFGNLAARFTAAVPIGLVTAGDGQPRKMMVPDPHTVVGPDQAVVVLAPSAAAARQLRQGPATPPTAQPGDLPPVPDQERRDILVVGFNSRIVALMRELASAPAARFHVTSLSQLPASQREQQLPGWVLEQLTIRYLDGDPSDTTTLRQAIAGATPDAIIVSGDHTAVHAGSQDAATVFSYLATQQIVQGAVPILAVAYSSTYADLLAQDADGANLPGTHEMIGGTLAWTLLRADITPVLNTLFDPYQVRLRTARLPKSPGAPARFAALYQQALAQGAVLAGIVGLDGTPWLAPPPDTPVEPGTPLLLLTRATGYRAAVRPDTPSAREPAG